MQRVLQLHGVEGCLIKLVKSSYEESKRSVRVGKEESKLFRVLVGLKHVQNIYVIVKIYVDGDMKELSECYGERFFIEG